MSRQPRSQLSIHSYFHVCVRGNNGQNLFHDDSDRTRYVFLIEKYRKQHGLLCYAYCLMTNHIHHLFLSPSVQKLSKAMHGLQLAYVVYFNHRHQRRGHLFESRFSSWVIKDNTHLLYTKEYIENNAVKAGMVDSNSEYPWSSAFRDRSAVTISKIEG